MNQATCSPLSDCQAQPLQNDRCQQPAQTMSSSEADLASSGNRNQLHSTIGYQRSAPRFRQCRQRPGLHLNSRSSWYRHTQTCAACKETVRPYTRKRKRTLCQRWHAEAVLPGLSQLEKRDGNCCMHACCARAADSPTQTAALRSNGCPHHTVWA